MKRHLSAQANSLRSREINQNLVQDFSDLSNGHHSKRKTNHELEGIKVENQPPLASTLLHNSERGHAEQTIASYVPKTRIITANTSNRSGARNLNLKSLPFQTNPRTELIT